MTGVCHCSQLFFFSCWDGVLQIFFARGWPGNIFPWSQPPAWMTGTQHCTQLLLEMGSHKLFPWLASNYDPTPQALGLQV
jgi:hypothetical protein